MPIVLTFMCCAVAVADDAALSRVLKEAVKSERVDYGSVKANHLPDLTSWLDTAATVDVKSLADKDRLAFYINLYNATMIAAVIDKNHLTFKPSDNDFAVFKEPRVKLKTGVITLDDLENKIIRPEFKDERIHVALVCGAVSCPPLLSKAYDGATLDRQLDENVAHWLIDPSRNVIDDASRTLKLSKIFEWFAADFGGSESIAGWVGRKSGRDVTGYRVEFLDYDWSLNSAK